MPKSCHENEPVTQGVWFQHPKDKTHSGQMIIELKKDSKNRNSAYKALRERVMVDEVQAKAMCL